MQGLGAQVLQRESWVDLWLCHLLAYKLESLFELLMYKKG